jgi:DNA-binding PadR family transcriptional regulator
MQHSDHFQRRRRDRGEFGFGRHGGPPHRRQRTRRGDIRLALLAGLSDGPAHGYELIQRLGERTGGRWKPSPGSVYPTLQMLEEGGFLSSTQQDDKKVYSITEAGRAELAAKVAEAGGTPPWLDGESAGGFGDFRKSIAQLVLAAKQVAMTDDPAQVQAAAAILDEARRKLYQLLADA